MEGLEQFSGSASSASSALNPVDLYALIPAADLKTDPMDWWRTRTVDLDPVRIIAYRYASVPAASTKSETVFSAAGRTITQYRAKLSGNIASALIMIRENIDLLPEGKLIRESKKEVDDDDDDAWLSDDE